MLPVVNTVAAPCSGILGAKNHGSMVLMKNGQGRRVWQQFLAVNSGGAVKPEP